MLRLVLLVWLGSSAALALLIQQSKGWKVHCGTLIISTMWLLAPLSHGKNSLESTKHCQCPRGTGSQ